MKNHGFHRHQRFSQNEVSFTENVTALKLWIKLVPIDRLWAGKSSQYVTSHLVPPFYYLVCADWWYAEF